MRIFKNKFFVRFAKQEIISDSTLIDAVTRAEKGLVDADLGNGVIKQRIARTGQGKAGGYRSIVFFRCGEKAIFVYGFAKSEQDNISRHELKAFKKLAAEILSYSDNDMNKAVQCGVFIEVQYHEEN